LQRGLLQHRMTITLGVRGENIGTGHCSSRWADGHLLGRTDTSLVGGIATAGLPDRTTTAGHAARTAAQHDYRVHSGRVCAPSWLVGTNGHGNMEEDPAKTGPRQRKTTECRGGRYWDRTSDLFGVNEAHPRCANRPSRSGNHCSGPWSTPERRGPLLQGTDPTQPLFPQVVTAEESARSPQPIPTGRVSAATFARLVCPFAHRSEQDVPKPNDTTHTNG